MEATRAFIHVIAALGALKILLRMLFRRAGLRITHLGYVGKWTFLGFIVGSAGGVLAILFQSLLEFLLDFIWPLNYHGSSWHIPAIVLIPALGGLASGLLVYSLAPEAEGHGTDAVIDALHNKWAKIRAKAPLVKFFASAITLASGGSAGKEGPIAQITGGVASVLAQKLRLDVRDR